MEPPHSLGLASPTWESGRVVRTQRGSASACRAGRLTTRPRGGEGGDNRMLLRSYVRAKVGWGDFRIRLHDRLVDWAGSERGGVAAEYALLITLIAIVII